MTDEEKIILELNRQGLTLEEMGKRLYLSHETVRKRLIAMKDAARKVLSKGMRASIFGSIRFDTDTERQKERIKKQTIGTKVWMRAPNGEHTNLTEDQWCIVRTTSFKDYFGDWELAALYKNAENAWDEPDYSFTYNFVPSEKLKERMEFLLGHEVSSLQITGNTVRHIKNRHGSNQIEHGQVNQTKEDIVLLPYLLNNFDYAYLSPLHNDSLGNKAVTVVKKINGVSVIGTIERGKKGVYVVSQWKTIKSSAAPMLQAPELNVLNDADTENIQYDLQKNQGQHKRILPSR